MHWQLSNVGWPTSLPSNCIPIHQWIRPCRVIRGRHSAAFFVQWVPYELKNKRWEDEEGHYIKHLLSIADQFAPGFSGSVVDVFTLTPRKIEQHFGISYGHLHHVDNTFGFGQRMPYARPITGLYSCGAGCHPAGSVIGSAGHNAAIRVLKDLARLYPFP
jgi:phytoene dehydrogenase-like protein